MEKIDNIGKKRKEVLQKTDKSIKKKSGFITILIGLGIVTLGLIRYFVISIDDNFTELLIYLVWVFGATLIVRGIFIFYAGLMKE